MFESDEGGMTRDRLDALMLRYPDGPGANDNG